MKKLLCNSLVAFGGIFVLLSVSCCTRDYTCLKPDHVGVRTGVDFEIQEGCNMKTKPSVHGCLDWNL